MDTGLFWLRVALTTLFVCAFVPAISRTSETLEIGVIGASGMIGQRISRMHRETSVGARTRRPSA
jgi:hypothetical protein